MPLLGILAATILLSHSLVPHKEYRFVYPGLLLLVLLAGIGFGEVLNRLRFSARGALACVLGLAFTSAVLAVQPTSVRCSQRIGGKSCPLARSARMRAPAASFCGRITGGRPQDTPGCTATFRSTGPGPMSDCGGISQALTTS